MNYNHVTIKYTDGSMKRLDGVIQIGDTATGMYITRVAYDGTEQMWIFPYTNVLSIRMMNKDNGEPDE